jgi:ubiquinone/menaquinone biosynthesis C-methylase UbiE
MPDPKQRWLEGRLPAIGYDSVVERERLARVMGFLLWGTDTRRLYAHIARLGEEPDGSEILDLPCGGGVAFRGLRPEQEVRYVAADLSPVMLARARKEAERRGLDRIEFMQADVESLPFDAASFDLVVTYTSLHCFPDSAVGLKEMARVLRPGGTLRGTTVVNDTGLRQQGFIRAFRAAGAFGPSGTADQYRAWLEAAGLTDVELDRSGAIAYLSGRKP